MASNALRVTRNPVLIAARIRELFFGFTAETQRSRSGSLVSLTSISYLLSPARLGLLAAAVLAMSGAAQAQVYWDFGTANPTSGVPANVTISAVSQGNNNGTTTMLSTSSTSSGYTGVSGTTNACAAARTGALVTGSSGSAYFEFTVTPNSGFSFTITSISFGSRETSTGPKAYTLRSSSDSYASDLATGTLGANSTWVLKSNTGLSINRTAATTYRIYGHSGTGTASANTANWRIDDLSLAVSATAISVPSISGFNPSVGKAGASVTISGSNFGSTTPTVTFANGQPATVTSFSSTSIVAVVPVGAVTGKISVVANSSNLETLTDFTIDNIAPQVVSYSPADDVSAASPGSVRITFNEAIAKGTGNIIIKKSSDDSIVETIAVSATQVSISGAVLTIKPTAFLAYSTSYYVEYDAGIVTDLAGNSLASGITGASTWNFTTKAESPIIITQYYEGLNNNKFIEIANVGGTSITLTGYSLVLWSNADAEGWKNTNTYAPITGSILDLSAVTLAPGQVYVVANSGAVLPILASSANVTSNITFFNGNDSVVLHNLSGGLTINNPASVVDAVSFTNIGNEGVDKSFVRIAKAPGYSLDSGSNITQFSDVWQNVDLGTANAAVSGDNAFLGSTSLATPPALLAFSNGATTVNEDAGTVNLTVVLSANIGAQVTAEVALDISSTATTGDIGSFATQTVTFPAGSTAGATQSVTVTITNDADVELSEKAVFKLQNIVGNAVAGAPATTTINIRPSDNVIANLLISEVPDPSNNGNYRYIEFFNPGSVDIDLAAGQWNLVRYSNGGISGQAIPLTGTVPAGGTFIIATNAADFAAGYPTAAAPGQISSQINGNGDDAYALYFGGDQGLGILRDIYGVVGETGAGTWDYTDKRAVRKSTVTSPNTTWTANEWVVASAVSAKMTPGAHPDTAPVVTSSLSVSATVGTAFEYQITANNNPTIYAATGLPGPLQFNTATGVISGTPTTAETLNITIGATNGGGTDSKTLVIIVGAANTAPTDIGLTANSIAENNSVNANVGTLSTTDADSSDTHTYSLVAGTGDTDNTSFNISGNWLRAGVAFDFETKSSYSIRVRTTDSSGATFDKPFTITVTDVVEQTAKEAYLASFGLSGADLLGTADPDGDGMNNDAEFAFGTSPVSGASRAATLSSGTGTIKLTYLQRDSGVTYTVKSLPDLATAFDSGTTVTPSASSDQTSKPTGYTRYEASVSTGGNRAFLRVKAVAP